MSALIQGLRERLGLDADSQLDDESVLNALDAALTARQEFTPPEGTILMDASQLADLQAAAEQGRQAREEQIAARRDGIADAAVADGRVAPVNRGVWRERLDENEAGTVTLLNTLPKSIPVTPMGYTGGEEASADDAAYNALYTKKES